MQRLPFSLDHNERLFIWAITLMALILLITFDYIDQSVFERVLLGTTGFVLVSHELDRFRKWKGDKWVGTGG